MAKIGEMSDRTDSSLQLKLERLRGIFAPMRSVMVAFSGGVDSTFVLRVAHDTLGARVLALTTTSPTMPDEDRRSALEMARTDRRAPSGRRLQRTRDSRLRREPAQSMLSVQAQPVYGLRGEGGEFGIEEIVDGLNLDDLHDYRPGIKAAGEKRVRHPLVEAELTKAEIRELSRALGLPTWDRPASPCLSSRFPYGTRITPEGLAKGRARRAAFACDGLSGRARALSWRGRAARGRASETSRACSNRRRANASIASCASSGFAS